jgi:hypothetical protein
MQVDVQTKNSSALPYSSFDVSTLFYQSTRKWPKNDAKKKEPPQLDQ